MTMIPTNPFLLGVSREEDSFKPAEILEAFDLQLDRRRGYQARSVWFLPPPSVEDAEAIVEASKAAVMSILEGHNLSPDAVVEDETAKKELIQLVRDHLKKFAY